MRQSKRTMTQNEFSILAVDDDPIMTSTLQAYFQRSGYHVDTENDPQRAIERVREGRYDILLLDFLMTPICGDQVVEQIRLFNHELFIVLLTGHKSMAPPIKTIRELDIQGYYEKSDRFDQLELLVESCVKSLRQMRTITNYKNGLGSIVEALPAIYRLQTMEQLSEGILQSVTALCGSRSAFLALDARLYGKDSQAGYLLSTLGPGPVAGTADIPALLCALGPTGTLWQDGVLFAPVNNEKNQAVGLVGLALEKEPGFDLVQLLDVFMRQASAAIRNAALHALVSAKNSELTQTYQELHSSYLETVRAMRLMVDARDIYTRGHSDRVSYYGVKIAQRLGRDSAYCERIRVAGLFHDIGKIGVPDGVLLKNGPLTEEEFTKVKAHSSSGAAILSSISRFRDIAPIVRAHHERLSGNGYPDGLCAGSIPEEACIIAVADAFDAMTSDRHYRKSLGLEKAIAELRHGKGSQFDPQVVDVFLDILEDYPAIEAELAWTHGA